MASTASSGRLAQRQEVDALAQRAVLRQVAAGLPHDPERRAIHRLAPAGSQEAVVHPRASPNAARPRAIVSSMTASSWAMRDERRLEWRRRQQHAARSMPGRSARTPCDPPPPHRPTTSPGAPRRTRVHIEPDALHRDGHARVARRARSPCCSRAPRLSSMSYRSGAASMDVERGQSRCDRERMRGVGASLVDRARGRDCCIRIALPAERPRAARRRPRSCRASRGRA